MKKIIILSLLLYSCFPKVDCIKIGMTYDEVIKSCGKPTKHLYRANYLSQVQYLPGLGSNKHDLFTIHFDTSEKVIAYHYITTEFEKRESEEDN